MVEPLKLPPTTVRTFDLYAEIDNPVPGSIDNWPPKIQDAVYQGLEKLSKTYAAPMAIVASWCEKNYYPRDDTKDFVWCIRAIVSEVIAARKGTTDTKDGVIL